MIADVGNPDDERLRGVVISGLGGLGSSRSVLEGHTNSVNDSE